MKKTRILLFTLLICIGCLLLNSCYPVAAKKYFDISEYKEIWELSGFKSYHKYNGTSTFFPSEPSALDVTKFTGRYDEQLPLGEGVEIYIEIQYDDSSYDAETKRLSAMSKDSSGSFNLENAKVYSTRMGDGEYSGVYEYAVTNDAEKKIVYIYLMHIPQKEIDFDDKYLPAGYKVY